MLNVRPPRQARGLYHVRTLYKQSRFTRPNISELPPQPQPSVTNEEGTKTFRLRQHGNESLPLPPLLDPIATEAKERHQRMKAVPNQDIELTDFQKALAENPYAQVLASPVRQCTITRARLPAHFLQSFSTTVTTLDAGSGDSLQPSLVPGSASPPSVYVLNHRSILDYLNSKKNWVAIMTPRMTEAFAKRTGRKNVKVDRVWSWDSEMPARVLEKLREDVVLQLTTCLADKPSLILALDQVPETGDISCLLIMQAAEKASGDITNAAAAPDHSLENLLSAQQFSKLPLSEKLRSAEKLAVLQDHRTVKLQLALDKLRAYVEHA